MYAPLKVTLRQVNYRLAAEGVLPHTAPMCRRLSAQLAQARREGRFPDLIDTVREVHVPPAWPDADAFVAEMPTCSAWTARRARSRPCTSRRRGTPAAAIDRLAHVRGHPRGRPSPAATASPSSTRSSGKWRHWSRTNSSAWSSAPSTRTLTATSSLSRSPAKNSSAPRDAAGCDGCGVGSGAADRGARRAVVVGLTAGATGTCPSARTGRLAASGCAASNPLPLPEPAPCARSAWSAWSRQTTRARAA